MRYGYFDDEKREYVITRPDTPLPWINYLGKENYFALISNTAGGYSFYKDARLRRLTRYRYNDVPSDSNGRYIYIRDETSGRFWSPTWQPVRLYLDEFKCRHGLGYTTILSSKFDIKTQIRYFVPPGEDLEIWDLSLTNARPDTAHLHVFSAIEFALWNALEDATNFQRNLSIGEVEIEENFILHKTEYRERRDHFAYFACSGVIVGYDTQRGSFLGRDRGWENPIAVEEGASRNSFAQGWAPIGSLQASIHLEPNKTERLIVVLGYQQNPRDQKFDPPESQNVNKNLVKPTIENYLRPSTVDLAFDELCKEWDRSLQIFQVETPDEHTNRMVNTWNQYQCMVNFNLSRSASYFESGISRGIGFRDSNQDLLGVIHMIPERARERILDLAATQLEDGGAFHQYQPLTKQGNVEIGTNFNDDPLWLVLAASAYLKETRDWDVLDELVPFENIVGSEGPLYMHLQRSIDYTLERLGPHGLPLIGRADWNDCLNLNTFSTEPDESFQTAGITDGKVAESVFIAGLFILAAEEMVQIASIRGREQEAKEYREAAQRMEAAVLKHGWDGEWFLRAYDHFGKKVGSHSCQEGQIFIEPQGVCIMAGIGLEKGSAQRALDSVGKRLATEHGILLHQPAYTSYQTRLGEITSYPPGYKENAGVFCHTNPWIMIAEALLGNGDRAMDYYLRINPSAREHLSEVHRCEPYVYAQMIAGRDAPTFGEAKNSWLTGTAAWNYVAITQWILGIRPTYQGLCISPVLPNDWPGFSVKRKFQGVTYHIEATRIRPGNEVRLRVEGDLLPGVIVPFPPQGTSDVNVEVTLL